MTDVFGNKVDVGDKIVYTSQISTSSGRGGSLGRSELVKGTVAKLRANGTQAVIPLLDANGNHIRDLYLRPENILKYDW